MATLNSICKFPLCAAGVLFLVACSPVPQTDASEVASDTSDVETAPAQAQPFTVFTYNVENLFDVDGVAMFDDYQQGIDDDPEQYNRAKFLTKLQTIADVLKTVNAGEGPEVILFQELEADATPESTVENYAAFLNAHKELTVAAMLGEAWAEDYAGFPASAWLLKTLADNGLVGYEVVSVPYRGADSGIAHTNAVFSKFPISSVARHPLVQARDILETCLDISGHPLIVYVNHWKSGASNPEQEPIRVENAKVLRGLLDARLAENPAADIIVAGDLNSHYNHSMLYPDMETGINDVLGSSGAEDFAVSDLYNLWFELPPEERYSEVWRGRRGTLMHTLITQGLYDDQGVSYVDGSFDKLVIPGLNSDAIGRPLDWNEWGVAGGGASDHFPVIAEFVVGPFVANGPVSKGGDGLTEELPLNYSQFAGELDLEDGSFISDLPEAELGAYMGQMYTLKASVAQQRPFRLLVKGKEWPIYVPNPELRKEVFALEQGTDLDLVVIFGQYRGNAQFVIEAMQ